MGCPPVQCILEGGDGVRLTAGQGSTNYFDFNFLQSTNFDTTKQEVQIRNVDAAETMKPVGIAALTLLSVSNGFKA